MTYNLTIKSHFDHPDMEYTTQADSFSEAVDNIFHHTQRYGYTKSQIATLMGEENVEQIRQENMEEAHETGN